MDAAAPRSPLLAEGALVFLGVVCLAGVVLWPLPAVLLDALAVAPEGEGVAHLWSWWALGEEGALVRAHVDRIAVPEGLSVHGIDPLHGLLFGLGAGAGLGVGFGLVQVVGLGLSGLGAWSLAGVAGADRGGRLLAAVMGTAAPTVVGAAVDGITEGLGAGWIALQLASLLALLRAPGWRAAVLWAGCLGAAAWAGPYNAVFSAMVSLPLLLWRGDRWRWTLPAGALGLALSAPVLRAAVALESGRPGAAGRSPPERPVLATAWRGAWRDGADLLDLLLPDGLTGAAAVAPATAYQGLVVVGLLAVALWRARRSASSRSREGPLWPWVVGGVLAASVALGPWLVAAGRPLAVGGMELRPPAALLEQLPVLSRLSRWYRAGAVATLLFAPVVARAVRGWSPPWVGLVGLLLVIDLRLGSPAPWPTPTVSLPTGTVLRGLTGPFVELPRVHPLRQPGFVADENLLLQVVHGESTSASRNNRPTALSELPAMRVVERVVRLVPPDGAAQLRAAAPELHRLGFRQLVLYRSRLSEEVVALAELGLGPPVAQDETVVVFSLGEGARSDAP